MDFDKGSPAYPDGTPATPVTNDGSELGTGKGEDYDTGSVGFIGYYGDDLSGRAGCSNNNWGVVHVTRRDIPDGKIFRKLLQTSKAEGQTIFEDGYTTFGKGDGERTLNYKYTGKGYILAEKVAAGTEIRVRLQINAKEVVGCRESGCKLTFYDSFDYTNKFLPSKGVVIGNGDRTYTDGVKVAWTEVPAVQGDDDKEPDTWHFNSTPDDEMPVDWSDGMPTEADVEEADDMSVKASYEITPEQAASDDPWEAVFYVRMQEGTNYSQDHMLGMVETKDGNAVKGNYSGAVDGVSVLPMYATASESVSVTDAQGRIPQRRASGRHARIRTVLERQERQGLRRLQGAVHGLRGPVAHRVQAARVRDRRVGHDRARQVQGRGERLRRRKHPAAVRPQGQGDLHGDVPKPLLDRQGLQLRQRLPHHLQPGENRGEHPGVAWFEGR